MYWKLILEKYMFFISAIAILLLRFHAYTAQAVADTGHYFYYLHFPPSFENITQWKNAGIIFNTSVVIDSRSKLYDSSLLIYDKLGIVHGFGDILYISYNRKTIVFQTLSSIVYYHPLSDWDIGNIIIRIYFPLFIIVVIICGYEWQSLHTIVVLTIIPIYFQYFITPNELLSELNFIFFNQPNFNIGNVHKFNGDECKILYNSHPFSEYYIFSSIAYYTTSFHIDILNYADFAFIECSLEDVIPNNVVAIKPNYIKFGDTYQAYQNWSIVIPFYFPYIDMKLATFMKAIVYNGTMLHQHEEIPLFARQLLRRRGNGDIDEKRAKKGYTYGIITVTEYNDQYVYSLGGGFNIIDESISGAKCVLMYNDGTVDYKGFVGYLIKGISSNAQEFGNICIRPNHKLYRQAYIDYIGSLVIKFKDLS